MDHPQGLERPWVTPSERRERAEQNAQIKAARQEHIRRLAEAVRLEPRGLELEVRHEKGEPLTFWDQVDLNRWRELKPCLDGDLPTQS